MILKEYVVVMRHDQVPSIWTRSQWADYLRNCDKVGLPNFIETGYRIITTFNADEQLQETGSAELDKYLEKINSGLKAKISLHAKNANLIEHLWSLVRAVGRLLDDKYSEGDAAVRNQLWKDMHRTGEKAREYLESLSTTEPGQPVPAGEWISVEKELPDFNQEVLVFGKRRLTQPTMDGNPPKVMLGYRQDLTDSSIPKRDWLRYADKNNFRMMEDVTHWRPLPAPPSPKQEDKQ